MTPTTDPLDAETLLPLLRPGSLGAPLTCLDRCPSTSTLAIAAALEGAPEGATWVAEVQTAGRGRLGRAWHSPAGENLYLSVVLRPALRPPDAPALTLACAVAVAEAVEAVTGLAPRVKWPNDLLLDGRKVAGILLEMRAEPERVAFVVVGVGLNVNTATFPAPLDATATSLRAALGRPLRRAPLGAEVLARLTRWTRRYVDDGLEAVRAPWLARATPIGEALQVRTPAGTLQGTMAGLAPDGALLVALADGTVEAVHVGEITGAEAP
jgi:BirA family biotin operon repressor/biotin-[acetyl-CoA-carboxylase] ligase